jgi:hypothetical protein
MTTTEAESVSLATLPQLMAEIEQLIHSANDGTADTENSE